MRGHAWRVFAIVVLLGIAQAILSSILRSVLDDVAGSFAGYALGDLLANTIIGPLSAIAIAVIYFELVRARPSDDAARPDAHFSPPLSGPPERPVRPTDPPKE